jgi:DsbC/DsbD-like thiol-disulfide interchange protein
MRAKLHLLIFLVAAFPVVLYLTSSGASLQQESPAISAAKSIVKAKAYVSLEPVPRGSTFEIAVLADVRAGYHMNSHKPADEFLIPTTLTAALPKGFRETAEVYPPDESLKLNFSQTPLLVYTGRVPIRLRVAVQPDAALGAVTIPLTLRYQACNDTTCLPPVKIAVPVQAQVAAAGAAAHSVHPEIFSAAKTQPKP